MKVCAGKKGHGTIGLITYLRTDSVSRKKRI